MNQYQKSLLRHVLIILGLSLAATGAMVNLKDWTNRSEAMRAMGLLSKEIKSYKAKNLSLPSEATLNELRLKLPGGTRLGKTHYRAIWMDYNAGDEEILAYAYKNYKSLVVKPGYVVLRLSGKTEWMSKEDFEELLKKQQSKKEFDLFQQNPDNNL